MQIIRRPSISFAPMKKTAISFFNNDKNKKKEGDKISNTTQKRFIWNKKVYHNKTSSTDASKRVIRSDWNETTNSNYSLKWTLWMRIKFARFFLLL